VAWGEFPVSRGQLPEAVGYGVADDVRRLVFRATGNWELPSAPPRDLVGYGVADDVRRLVFWATGNWQLATPLGPAS
jgi:hypothetical protein